MALTRRELIKAGAGLTAGVTLADTSVAPPNRFMPKKMLRQPEADCLMRTFAQKWIFYRSSSRLVPARHNH